MDLTIIENFIHGGDFDDEDSTFRVREWHNNSRNLYYEGMQLVEFKPDIATLAVCCWLNVANHLNDFFHYLYKHNIFTNMYIFKIKGKEMLFTGVNKTISSNGAEEMTIVFTNVPSFRVFNNEYCATLHAGAKIPVELNFADVLGV